MQREVAHQKMFESALAAIPQNFPPGNVVLMSSLTSSSLRRPKAQRRRMEAAKKNLTLPGSSWSNRKVFGISKNSTGCRTVRIRSSRLRIRKSPPPLEKKGSR
jgi:Mn-containing catalase